jgi:type II secretory pathway pseudopilin PulG
MLRRKHIAGNREGVAGAVATIFVLLIVLSFINIFIGSYVPSYMSTQEYSHMQEAYQEFSNYQLQAYTLQSGAWHYPMPSTIQLGSNGYAPFASPTPGTLAFQPGGFNASISYSVGVPQYLPNCGFDMYNNTSGTATGSPGSIQLTITFLPNTAGNNTVYTSGNTYRSGPIWYVPNNSVLCYYINGSYINKDTGFRFYLGINSTNPKQYLNNFTLITYVYGSHNRVWFSGLGNNLSIWYISYGNNNSLGKGYHQYECGFRFIGNNDKGYAQNYGTNDIAPPGWPHFISVHQSMSLSGLLSLYVQNRYYTPQTVTYEGGSIILNQSGQVTVLKNPQFSLENTSAGVSLSMDLMSLNGNPFSASGSGSANLLSTYFSNQSFKVFQYKGMNLINNISISITSPEISGWMQMLNPYLVHLKNVTSDISVANLGNGCNSPNPYVLGAYSLTVHGDTLNLMIFNIASLIFQTGTLSVAD